MPPKWSRCPWVNSTVGHYRARAFPWPQSSEMPISGRTMLVSKPETERPPIWIPHSFITTSSPTTGGQAGLSQWDLNLRPQHCYGDALPVELWPRERKEWWTRRASNPLPPACKTGALPIELRARMWGVPTSPGIMAQEPLPRVSSTRLRHPIAFLSPTGHFGIHDTPGGPGGN